MSILITSTTDIISFYTAVLAPYPYVKIFCLYTGTALLVNLIYQVGDNPFYSSYLLIPCIKKTYCQVTFFAACVAISGRFEEQRRSGLTFCQVSSCQCNLHRKCQPIENCTLKVFWIVVRENFRVYTVHLTLPNHRLGRAEDTRRVCV